MLKEGGMVHNAESWAAERASEVEVQVPKQARAGDSVRPRPRRGWRAAPSVLGRFVRPAGPRCGLASS